MNIHFSHIEMPQPWTPGGDYPERQTVFGLPVMLNSRVPQGEMWLVDELGTVARIRNGAMTIRHGRERDAREPRPFADALAKTYRSFGDAFGDERGVPPDDE